MFFFIIGVMIGIFAGQEYKDLPNMKQVVKRASSILREAIRGENDEEELKNE